MSDDLARDETPWLIWKASREGFYRPDRRGYTGRIEDAGRYTREEAEAECHIEPWNIYAIPAREPPRSFHPPQEHTWTGLKKVRDFIETKFPTTIEGTLHDDAETMLNECDAVLASSPQGTVRDPGALYSADERARMQATNDALCQRVSELAEKAKKLRAFVVDVTRDPLNAKNELAWMLIKEIGDGLSAQAQAARAELDNQSI